MDIKQALSFFDDLGITYLPLHPRSKKTYDQDWTKKKYGHADFVNGCNIGIKTGKASGNFMDMDLDWPEAVEIAHYYLPPTKFVFGRKSKPDSHLGYRVTGRSTTVRYQVPGGGMILELRGDGCQTMAPWSTHPDGEPVTFTVSESLGEYRYEELKKASGRAAAACLLYRNFVTGSRHNMIIALIGCLLRDSWTTKMVRDFITPILMHGAKDNAIQETILREVDKLSEKLKSRHGHVPGYTRLREVIGEAADYVCDWLGVTKTEDFVPNGYTAEQLGVEDIAEAKWLIPGMLTEGVVGLVGKPKMRKTWTAMNILLAAACGGKAFGDKAVEKCGVAYLALEDNKRRMKKRLSLLMQAQDITRWPSNFHIFHEWPRNGVVPLRAWLEEHPEVKLIVIDTLARFREMPKSNANVYLSDYDAIAGLTRLAGDLAITIMLVHHTRKTAGDDPLDEISGSNGISGSLDTIWVLRGPRLSQEADLLITGRDIEEEREVKLHWDNLLMSWRIEAEGMEVQVSAEHRELLALLKGAEGLTAKELALKAGKSLPTVYEQLRNLKDLGLVFIPPGERYRYVAADF